MKRVPIVMGLIALTSQLFACVAYSGVSRADGVLYISGGTNYFVYTAPWVRRCEIDGNQLRCEELTESPSAPRARTGAPAAGAPAAPPPAAK